MGNNVSTTRDVLTAADVTDYIRRNPGIFLDLFGELEEHEKKRRRINGMSTSDWWKTSWGQMLLNDNVKDISTREGKEFRRRFRVPAPFFLEWLVPMCREKNIFASNY